MDEVGRFRYTVRRQQHNTRTNNKPYRQFPSAAANSRVLLGDQDHVSHRQGPAAAAVGGGAAPADVMMKEYDGESE